MFASDLDAASRRQLDRGSRLMELLRQPQGSPYPVEEQTVVDLRSAPPACSTSCRSTTCCASSASSSTTSSATAAVCSTRSATPGSSPTTRRPRLAMAYDTFLDQFETGEGELAEGRPRGVRGAGRRGRRAGADRQAEARLRWPHRCASCARGSESVEATKKITRAMELIAASRIVKAQQRAAGGDAVRPGADACGLGRGDVLERRAPADVRAGEPDPGRRARDHQRPRPRRRLLLERAQGGGAARREAARRGQEGRPVRHRAQGRRPTTPSVSVRSCRPGSASPTRRTYDNAREIGETLIEAFIADDEDEHSVDEVHVVYSRFRSMLVQEPSDIRLLPLEVVEGEEKPPSDEILPLYDSSPAPRRCSTRCCRGTSRAGSSTACSKRRRPSSPRDSAR